MWQSGEKAAAELLHLFCFHCLRSGGNGWRGGEKSEVFLRGNVSLCFSHGLRILSVVLLLIVVEYPF